MARERRSRVIRASGTTHEPTIVAISGSAASGAVRLARALGERPGFVLAGDVKKVWSRGACDNRECGCGRPFLECPFWREIGERAFGGWSRVDLERVIALSQRVHSHAALPRLLASARPDPDTREYGSYLDRLFRAMTEMTGSSHIVCFAKHPYQGVIFRRVMHARLRWVHVVRDPREIAWLWTRGSVLMRRDDWLPRSTAGIVYKWARYNTLPPALSGLTGCRTCGSGSRSSTAIPRRRSTGCCGSAQPLPSGPASPRLTMA